jgi:hypothetical protein
MLQAANTSQRNGKENSQPKTSHRFDEDNTLAHPSQFVPPNETFKAFYRSSQAACLARDYRLLSGFRIRDRIELISTDYRRNRPKVKNDLSRLIRPAIRILLHPIFVLFIDSAS